MSPVDVNPRPPRHSVAEAILTWVYIAIIALALVLIGLTVRRALAEDGFVRRIEFMLHTSPGQMIPANPAFPDIRLRYLGAREVGHGLYEIRIQRLP